MGNGQLANRNCPLLIAYYSPLALFEARVLFVDYVQLAFAPNNLAICTSLFYGSSYFHNSSFEL